MSKRAMDGIAFDHGRRLPPGIPFTAACRAHVCPQLRSALKNRDAKGDQQNRIPHHYQI
ncbi:hypothetical protein [Azotosporobacter soli]|uniref:hypothetical protein n=1 Tax=Azotosporobacter soli TaxID=3055040 RepID=UPI0031FED56A